MCTLPLLAGENISARFVVPTVAASVDRVIRCGIDQHGVRRVTRSWVCPAGSRTT
jgi:pilus assembly protein CpaF